MINLKIGGKVYKIPTSYKETTLNDFIKIGKLGEKFDYFTILSRLTGISEEVLENNIPLAHFKTIVEGLKFLEEQPLYKNKKSLKVGGNRFKLMKNFDNITIGEWTDIEFYIKKYNENLYEAFPYILAIIMRRKPLFKRMESYNSDLVDERAELFRYIPVLDALSFVGFFLYSGTVFITNILNFSKNKEKKTVPVMDK